MSWDMRQQPKPGEEWSDLEAARYNITVKPQSLAEFFGVQILPDIPQSVEDICAVEDKEAATDDATYNTLHLMQLAQESAEGTHMAVDCFIAHLLQRMGFVEGRRLVLMGYPWQFDMVGRNTHAFTDVCLVDEKILPILLVRTDKRGCRLPGQTHILEMPLVAAAIAAFRETNDARHLRPRLDKITFPAIIMEFGTLPMFYKICISQQFWEVVSLSRTDLTTSMTVYCHYPQVDFRHLADGMMRLETRRELLRYMEAFRQLIMSGEMNAMFGCL
ncbi:hypothetical protein PILCRDRAFT_819980 [Piloderma croceum F 1598]|uniref:Fungal-type protein kinase domain-containing protein n=1 Tax=Piloderma croceum (strain F 1598) TaxID=765440 RepID=A0A0C3B8S1_PILCF|nr:hypothetical protein PILCRDRAFT_819980 [Piloderma croceum F 1598]